MRRLPVLPLLALVRAHACATAAALALLGAFLAGEPSSSRSLFPIAVAVFLVTAGGNALNDACDAGPDLVNRRERPIPSGALSRRTAVAVGATCLAAGAVAGSLLTPWCAAICLSNVVLVVAYARCSKRLGLAKDLLVGYLVGSTVLFGALDPARVDAPVATLAVCAALATAARELLKDVEDVPGDRAAGARTLPLVIGTPRSEALAYLLLGLAVALGFSPPVTEAMSGAYAIAAAGGALVFGLSFLSRRPRTRQLLVMAGSVVEMGAFWAGKVLP